METISPAVFQSNGVLCVGQPFHPGAAQGRCTFIVQDDQVLETFTEQCRDLGQDLHADPYFQVSYQRNRGDFLRIAVILSDLARLHGLTVMGMQRTEGTYPEAEPSTRVITPGEALLYLGRDLEGNRSLEFNMN